MTVFFKNLKNNLDFFLRCKITLSRRNYYEKNGNFENICITDEQKNLYENLAADFDISRLKNTSERVFLENLYYLSVFNKYLSRKKNNKLSVLDIGSKNWSYAGSEYLYFHSTSDNVTLKGIELDAYRMCAGFYTRYEIAKFYTKDFENTEYIAGDFLKINEKFDRIIWILPFITEYPLLKWGLPLRYFKPQKMLMHACNLLNSGGEMLIINQGEDEYEIQKNLYSEAGLTVDYLGKIPDEFRLFKNERYCSKYTKD